MTAPLTEPAAAAEALERFLGDPREPGSRMPFAEALDLDEREAFPERAVAALDAWGLQGFYVPEPWGGALRSFETLTALVRAVARRDLTAAIAHAKTFLGVGPVWIAGTDAQRRRLGATVVAGGRIALGLTEAAHGGDLFATETAAVETASGHSLSGEKWLINNATRCDAITVLARTDPRGGPRGCSLFLVSKRGTPGITCLPKIPTHGIRGADISSIRLDACPLPPDARIGLAGQGIEVMMKSLQLTRVLVPGVSLGALDTGLRHVLDFARSRRLGGGAVVEIPHARRILTEAFVELLAAEAVVRAGARSVHVAPGRLAIWSAVVKFLVPSRVQAALRRLAVVLGARHYIRGDLLEKVLRDHALVALFDGSTVVNLSALAQELPRLGSGAARRAADEAGLRDRVAALFDLRAPLPAFRPEGLDLVSRGGDDGPGALVAAKAEIERLPGDAAEHPVDAEVRSYLATMAGDIAMELAVTAGQFRSKDRPPHASPEAFAAAERYAHLHAAAACILVWLRSRGALDAFFAGGEWLAIALAQLVGPSGAPPPGPWYERVFARLAALDEAGRTFALEPLSPAPAEVCRS